MANEFPNSDGHRRRRESLRYVLSRFKSELGDALNLALDEDGSVRSATDALSSILSLERHEIVGLRTETLFRELAVALGQTSYVKQEDQGDWITQDVSAKPVDFLVGLKNGMRFAIEVKNCHKETGALSLRSSDVSELENYAQLVCHELRLAIYWSKWRLWTLVDPTCFESDGDKLKT